ncbi:MULTISPECIES: aspartate aminotransferase family protein [Shouchella]|uniref:Aspartate aminotransferase family protein n=1 Tax=Shouchella hunanensis TaxID=766894 RepID=A0ABY7W6Z8_9BACI|nr:MULTISPECIES: aspartate aminotransferase family protein [Shouchella]WDF04386.1 aspartate aminotransferase family protein [Shouchella hunanensis]GAF21698.1 siderophore biosynthesis diaminobutyrate--2-oxoglutarate aminotransferase [Bacillus sp. JCM 19047]
MSQSWNELQETIPYRLAPSMAKDHPNLPVVKEEGCYYYGVDGKTYLDFTSGIAVTNVGHRHPKVVEAIKQEADSFTHGPIGVIQYESILKLANELADVMPGDLDCFFFGNSGTEAIEGALKLARHVTNRPNVVSFTGCFHGRTLGAMSVSTSKAKYRAYQPAQNQVYQLPYYQPGESADEAIAKLEKACETMFAHYTLPEEVACFIIEPVLGEGGYIVPPAKWLQQIREICNKHGILLIFDEVQTGFGRTGEWFAAQSFDVIPDIMAVAKGIASGLPLSATVANHTLMQQWPLGSHATTFGGNPIACAAARATLQIIKEENLLANVKEVGSYAAQELTKLQQAFPCIGSIRHLGMMFGIEIVDPETGRKDGDRAAQILDLALEEGVLFYFCGNEGEVLRMIPPLTITKEQIDEGLVKLRKALQRLK